MWNIKSFVIVVIVISVFIDSANSTGLLLNRIHDHLNQARCNLHGLHRHRHRGREFDCGVNQENEIDNHDQTPSLLVPNQNKIQTITPTVPWNINSNQHDNLPNIPQRPNPNNIENNPKQNQGGSGGQKTWNDKPGEVSGNPEKTKKPGNVEQNPAVIDQPIVFPGKETEGTQTEIKNEERGNFEHDNETELIQPNGENKNKSAIDDGLKNMEMIMGPELTLSAYNETKYVGESFFVICNDATRTGVIWIGPNGIALNEYSRPVVTALPEAALIFFDKARKEDQGSYSCTRGLRQQKYHLSIDESPPVMVMNVRRIMAVGSNCPKGYYYENNYCRQSNQ